jgi:hypothetical protein
VNDPAGDAQKLLQLNLEMGERERVGAGSGAFFGELLDANFCFRRGTGTTVDKQGYLDGLADPGNRSDVLRTDVRQIHVLGDQAFVEAWVYLEGTRGGKPVIGTFRNLRLFERAADGWRCVMWFNKPVQQ